MGTGTLGIPGSGNAAATGETARPEGKIICTIRQRWDLKGWEIEANALQHNCWHLTPWAAIGYAKFRTRGQLAEIRVMNSLGDCIRAIECDQRGWKDGLKFPTAGSTTGEEPCPNS